MYRKVVKQQENNMTDKKLMKKKEIYTAKSWKNEKCRAHAKSITFDASEKESRKDIIFIRAAFKSIFYY